MSFKNTCPFRVWSLTPCNPFSLSRVVLLFQPQRLMCKPSPSLLAIMFPWRVNSTPPRRRLTCVFSERKSRPLWNAFAACSVIFLILWFCCVVFGCCGGKIGVEGKIIGNDQSSRNARRCEMVWRERKDRKNAIAGILEQMREWIEHCPHSVEGDYSQA